MNEELEIIILSTKDSMELSVDHLKKELLKYKAITAANNKTSPLAASSLRNHLKGAVI